MYPTDFTGRFLNKLWYFRLNCLHRNILYLWNQSAGGVQKFRWNLYWIISFVKYIIAKYQITLIFYFYDPFFFSSKREAKYSTSRIKVRVVCFDVCLFWKEYFPKLLESTLLVKIFVFWDRDLKFWLQLKIVKMVGLDLT